MDHHRSPFISDRSALLLVGVLTAVLVNPVGGVRAEQGSDRLPRGTWPTSNVVLAEFAAPYPDWLPGHRGLDLDPGPDGRVYAPRAGTVTWRGQVGGIPVLVISHGVTRSTYQPVVSSLARGTQVATGDPVGTLTGGGHCEANCLHWGLKIGDRYLDPRLLIWPPHAILVSEPSTRRMS